MTTDNAETALRQAGFKIKRAFLSSGDQLVPVSHKAWRSGAFGRSGDSAKELAFMKRHGFVDPDALIERGHDMFLELVPITN